MNKSLEYIKSILKLRGFDFTDISTIQYISTYITTILGYEMMYNKINSLNMLFINYSKDFKPSITLSLTLEKDFMSITGENATWYIDEIKYKTEDILDKIMKGTL